MIQPIGASYRLTQSKIAGQDDILPSEGDEQGALRGPRPDARNGRQLGDEIVVW